MSAFKPENSIIILGGDFKCVTDVNLDRSRTTSKVDSSAKRLKEAAANAFQLKDIWRHQNPDKKELTFYSNVGTGSRLDRFYVTRNITTNVIESKINNFAHSDHSKISIKIYLSEIERGPGIWKINNSYLKDPEYIQQITHVWYQHQFKRDISNNINGWWEEGKKLIKETSIKFSKKKNQEKKSHKRNLLKQFRNIKNKLDKDPSNTRNRDLYNKINNEIKSIEVQEGEGAKIRSKAQWREDGETSSRYFCSLEKKRGADKTMRSVQRLKNGPIVTGNEDMLKETRQFYVDLYTEEGVEESAQDSMLSRIKTKLTKEQAQLCEGEVTHEEITQAVTQTQNDRSPGIDGLTYEFYKSFWQVIGNDLVKVFNHSFENKELPESQQYGLLTLLCKKGDRALLSNWRPISLLNTDYKVLAKALSVRLSKVLANIVSEDQTCGVPGRTILNNVFILRDLVVICKQKNIPAAIISIDQMKAFDRVNWSFMYKTLRTFGFKDTFIQWIQLLYSGAKSIVKVNGFLSDPFHTQRGVRQGDPLSPLLYIFIAEVFAISVRADPKIKGIPVASISHKISQYADDTSLTVVGNESIERLAYHLDLYERASGAKVNREKCEGLWLGSNQNRTDKPLGFKWQSDKIKALGIHIGNMELSHAIWDEKIDKVVRTLNLGKMRDLSFKGKRTVINILAAACLWYHAFVYHIPQWAIKKLKEALWTFLWGNKKDPVRRDIAVLPFDMGGLRIVDLEKKSQAIKMSWIAKLFDENCPGKFKYTMIEILNQYKQANFGKKCFQNLYKFICCTTTTDVLQ